MAISIVNGFFCANSCDVSKAKKGEDPHPSTNPDTTDANKGDKGDAPSDPARAGQPAVLFGGALSSLNGTSQSIGVQPVDGAASSEPATFWSQKPAIDLLA